MSFFNPAQMQSTLNSPMYAQLMQQMQGSGALQQPATSGMPNMAPQIPQFQGSQMQAGGQAPQMQTPQAQPGFFQQMASSPQGMVNGINGLTSLGSMGSGLYNGASSIGGSLLGQSLGAPISDTVAGPSAGSGLLGMTSGGSSGSGLFDSFMSLFA